MFNTSEFGATHKICETFEDALATFRELDKHKIVSVDTETSGLNPYKNYICGFVFGHLPGVGYYIPIRHFNNPHKEEVDSVINLVRDWLGNTPEIEKVFWNAKFDLKMLSREGIKVSGVVHDGMVLLPLADRPTVSEKLALKDVAREILGVKTLGLEALQQEKRGQPIKEWGYACLDYRVVGFYACEDAIFTIKMWEYLLKRMGESNG